MADFYAGAEPLTLLCPIKNGAENNQSYASITRTYLQNMDDEPVSPMSKVPQTFLCRFYILNDVFFEGLPAKEDHLKSKYLVFSSNYHGSLDSYLKGFWQNAEPTIRGLWQHCVAFDSVTDKSSFIDYIKRCLVKTTFFFNGSSGRPLEEQLKALYLKQEFSQFAVDNQGKGASELRTAFQEFIRRCQPSNLAFPTWQPGMESLDSSIETRIEK